MTSFALSIGVFLVIIVRICIAIIAIALAVYWDRPEFIGGLFFLFLWTIFSAMYLVWSVVIDVAIFDFSQFGFILMALIAFIIGMRPKQVQPGPGS
jgi:hypothetical protein